MQRGLVRTFADLGADKRVATDESRVLRLTPYRNRKTWAGGVPTSIIEHSEGRHTLAALAEAVTSGMAFSANEGLTAVPETPWEEVLSDTTLLCWGNNYDGDTSPPSGTFSAESTGRDYSCAIRPDASLACWGDNSWGQASPPAGTYLAGAAGSFTACGIRSDATLVCWGDNLYCATCAPSGTFKAVTEGWAHGCGIRTDDTVACWGLSYYFLPPGTYKTVSASEDHTCGIRTDATIACYGDNQYGQSRPPAGTYRAVSAGDGYSCAIRMDATLYCWGENDSGQASPPQGPFRAVSAASEHTCGIRTDGTGVCWGLNNFGQFTVPTGLTAAPGPPAVLALPWVRHLSTGLAAGFEVAFSSPRPGQGYVLFGPGPGCTGLIETATQDRGAGTTEHEVTVTGDDMNLLAGAVVPGTTYHFVVETVTTSGVERDTNGGRCSSVTIPSG